MVNRLDVFVPTTSDPWNERKAAHLARRAGFGACSIPLQAVVGDGSESAFHNSVDALLNYPDDDLALDDQIAAGPSEIAEPTDRVQLASHWLYRMRHANHPLQEQLTLFWHDHFANEFVKVRSRVTYKNRPLDLEKARATTLMRNQNYFLRRQGIKDFRALLSGMTTDPAMLIYLDNWLNVKGRAQENYAREVLELFSMGPYNHDGQGNYNEQDIRELARVLTGHQLNATGTVFGYFYKFNASAHDDQPKRIFGHDVHHPDGVEELNQALGLILDHSSTASFIAAKLIRWFVHPDPDREVIDELAAELRSNGFVFREALRKLFKSRYFYEPQQMFAIHKTPADFTIHLLRQMQIHSDLLSSPAGYALLENFMTTMGMSLFAPPNVAGWDHGRAWVSSDSLIRRYNLAERIGRVHPMRQSKTELFFADFTQATNDEVLDAVRERLIQDDLLSEEEAILLAHLEFVDQQNFTQPDLAYYTKIASLVHLLCASPRYQLK